MTHARSMALFILGIAIAAPRVLFAAPAPQCSFEKQLGELKSVQEHPDANSFEAIRTELAVRKNILRNAIQCSRADVEKLRDSLKAVATTDEDLSRLKARFIEGLDGAIAFYDTRLATVNDLGLWGSQNLSSNLKEWRAHTYVPLQDQTVAFAIWVKNQELIRAARSRYDEITRAMKLLGLTENEDIRGFFDAAGEKLGVTESSNNDARRLLLNSGPSEASLTAIKDTLTSLQDTYKAFFDLSDAVGKILPR